MDPLATPDDVGRVLQRTFTDEESGVVDDYVAKASDLFREAAGKHQFTPGSSTVRLRVVGGRVRLDQSPVTAVASVVDDSGTDVAFTRNGRWINVPECLRFVTVAYSHGSTEIPDDVRVTVAEMAARALAIPTEVLGGLRAFSDTAKDFSQQGTYDTGSIGAQVFLTQHDREVAAAYRWPGGHVIVQTP